ncbi:MAG: ABC transporter permease [Candidatus Methanofastidiosia archaeon]
MKLQPIRKVGFSEDLSAISSIIKHELLVSNFRYPLRVFSRFVGPLVWVAPYLFFGKALLGGMSSQKLYELTGISHMPTFLIVGTIVTLVSFNMMWLMSFAIRLESYRGTFESIYASPVSKFTFLLGKLIASTVWSFFYIVGVSLMGVIFLDVGFCWSRVPDAFILMLLLIFAMFGFGLIVAGLMLVYKEAHTAMHFLDGLFSLIVPMAYPLVVLPQLLQKISLTLPMTHAVISSRNILILGEGISQQGTHIAVLLIYIFVFIPLGMFFYKFMERKAKIKGVLHKY